MCVERCLLDGASGESVSAVEAMRLLSRRGWDVSGLSTSAMAGGHRLPAAERVEALSVDRDVLTVHHATAEEASVRVVRAGAEAGGLEELAALSRLVRWTAAAWRPDVALVGGGARFCRVVGEVLGRSGISAALWLDRPGAVRPEVFGGRGEAVPETGGVWRGVVVPSRFMQRLCRERAGVSAELVYPMVRRERVHCPVRRPMYVTYVSPTPGHGVGFAATLVAELRRRRPDIPVLVVEGSGRLELMERLCGEGGLGEWSRLGVRTMQRAEDPRTFLAVSRVLLVPAVRPVGRSRLTLEALVNGVPVLASDAGALAELFPISGAEGWHFGTFGGGLLPVASRLMSDDATDGDDGADGDGVGSGAGGPPVRVATRGEVGAWVQAIERLWDDEAMHAAWSAAGPASAARFDAETMADRLDGLLRQWSAGQGHGAGSVGGGTAGLGKATAATGQGAAEDDVLAAVEREAGRLLAWPDRLTWDDGTGPGDGAGRDLA